MTFKHSSKNNLTVEDYRGTKWNLFVEKVERQCSFVLQYSIWKSAELLFYFGRFSFSHKFSHRLAKNALLTLQSFFRMIGTLISIGVLVATIPIYCAVQCVRLSISILPHRKFAYLTGKKGSEKTHLSNIRLCVFNSCMLSGTLPLLFGKKSRPTSRVTCLTHFLQGEKGSLPDMLFLSEVGRTVERELVKQLKPHYCHFFLSAGLSCFQESGLFVASNCPLIEVPSFLPYNTRGLGIQSIYNRGFFVLKTKEYHFIFTHLSPGKEKKHEAIRTKQIEEIQTYLQRSEKDKKWLLVGDLNIDRLNGKNREYQALQKKGFCDLLGEKKREPTRFTPSNQAVDYVMGFGPCNTFSLTHIQLKKNETLSDHYAIEGILERTELPLRKK